MRAIFAGGVSRRGGKQVVDDGRGREGRGREAESGRFQRLEAVDQGLREMSRVIRVKILVARNRREREKKVGGRGSF